MLFIWFGSAAEGQWRGYYKLLASHTSLLTLEAAATRSLMARNYLHGNVGNSAIKIGYSRMTDFFLFLFFLEGQLKNRKKGLQIAISLKKYGKRTIETIPANIFSETILGKK